MTHTHSALRAARVFAVLALVTLFGEVAHSQIIFKSPQPGEVYKEYIRWIDNYTNDWRVCDPNIDLTQYPQAAPFIPNPTLYFDIDDMSGAIRAEALLTTWGGHVGTTNKTIAFNGNTPILINEMGPINGVPAGSGQCYIQEPMMGLDVPLYQLHAGSNYFQANSGGQTCHGFGWGHWGIYALIMRIYYDPASKPHATGTISSPSGGGSMGEYPTVSASVSGSVNRVDFLAYYDGYDTDGDGIYQEYHHDYHHGKDEGSCSIKNHVGTATGAPWQVAWNTEWVPDQAPGSIKILARIRDNNGVWYVTPEATGLSLVRSGYYLKLYKPQGVPESFWVQGFAGTNKSCYVTIPPSDNLANATSALLHLRTWNGINEFAVEPGLDGHYVRVGGYEVPPSSYGIGHFYKYDQLGIPTSALGSGTNTISFFANTNAHHGIEISWPGPGLVVRYGGTQTNTPPSITTHPQNVTVTVGQTATFTVLAVGTAPLSYQWQKNNADIPGANSASYTTPATTSGDNGATFRCVVTNGYGSATSNPATLTIGTTSSPTITTHPTDQTVDAGQTATFNVVASGTAPLSYQWQRNSSDIPGATSASYTTPAVTIADSGALFRCVVTNSGGTATSNTAKLIVRGATGLQITQNPLDQLVGVGQPAVFTVWISGTGTITYQWQKNGTDIPSATSASYTTPATALADSGTQFRCVIKNSLSTITSNPAILKVTTGSVSVLPNSSFENGTTGWSFYTNGSGTFTTVAAGANNPHAAKIAIATEGSNVQMNLQNAVLEENTKYVLSFRAYSNTGHDVSVSILKNVSPYGSYGLSGQVFDLTTQWKDFSIQFTTSGFTAAVFDARLMFWLASYDAAGDEFYFDDVVLAKVTSVAPPTIATHPANKTVSAGQTATFSVVAAGSPPFSYQWQKNTADIASADQSSYTTPATTSGDNGASYRCVVTNPVGSATSNAGVLTVGADTSFVAPKLVSPAHQSSGVPTTVTFRWSKVATATSYHLQVTTDSLFAGSSIVNDSTLTDTSRGVSGFANSTKLYWRVRAKSASGSTAFSSAWWFTTVGVPPAQVVLVSPAHGTTVATTSPRLIWNRSTPGVTRYWLEIATDSLFTAGRQVDSTVTDSTKLTSGLLNNTTYWWKVRAGNADGWGAFSDARRFKVVVTDVTHEPSIPTSYALEQNYPNPFNPSTQITFAIPKDAHVRLEIFTLLGNNIATLVDERLAAGRYTVTFNTGSVSGQAPLSSGPYIYRLTAGGTVIARKMAFVK